MERCFWCTSDPLYIAYHDNEWGVPIHDDRLLFEFLILEGAQAGLSWFTILKKRENYKEAFDHFDFEKIARYDEDDIERLMANKGIVRNRRKIQSAINNAKSTIKVCSEFGSLNNFLWKFVNFETIQNEWKNQEEIPASTSLSDTMSKELKRRGFNFVGSTICYSFMQAVGMVNDHIIDCYRYRQVRELK